MRAFLSAAIAFAFFAPVAGPARAQNVVSPVVTVDQDRLFNNSQFGQRVQSDHETRVHLLSQENRLIEAELINEERALTEQRADLAADAFRTLADAFDDKVQRIRAEQDAKAATLGQALDNDRQEFLRLIGPVLQTLVIERGAVALLDRRAVIISADSIDITSAAVARIDSTIGDGTGAPLTSQQVPATQQPEPRPAQEERAGDEPVSNLPASGEPSINLDASPLTPIDGSVTQPAD